MKHWVPFPHPRDAFAYPGASLKKQWARLHRGDCEPFPDAEAVREAWRAYHHGDFQLAWQKGAKAGPAGHLAAAKAAGTYASYLERDKKSAAALLSEAAKLCEAACEALPQHANAHYLLAYCLGRYAQKISVTRALADGVATRVKDALERALKLEPRHAEAHIATGTYHVEVISKVGALLGGLTYGASESEALAHYRKALKLLPDSAIARLEYARGLMLLDEGNADEARELLAQAAKIRPTDAAELLDAEHAQERLEELEA
ncbi:MAG TPA: tetratricopeptide repeat protein [Burkholderiales bacterium]|nr:tetratricopeptide repeat protein [Burkholderiales bacterium]